MTTLKTNSGRFFEDFSVGQVLEHATPRTLTAGDASLYMGLYGPRFAVQSSDVFAQAIGYPSAPLDDLLVFHTFSAKRCPTSRSMPSPTSAMPNAGSSKPFIPAIR